MLQKAIESQLLLVVKEFLEHSTDLHLLNRLDPECQDAVLHHQIVSLLDVHVALLD
jgi:hypothetical protein